MKNENKLEKVLTQRRLINSTLRERRETEDSFSPRPSQDRIDRREEGSVVPLPPKEGVGPEGRVEESRTPLNQFIRSFITPSVDQFPQGRIGESPGGEDSPSEAGRSSF